MNIQCAILYPMTEFLEFRHFRKLAPGELKNYSPQVNLVVYF